MARGGRGLPWFSSLLLARNALGILLHGLWVHCWVGWLVGGCTSALVPEICGNDCHLAKDDILPPNCTVSDPRRRMFGRNDQGELGLGNTNNNYSPARPGARGDSGRERGEVQGEKEDKNVFSLQAFLCVFFPPGFSLNANFPF